MKSFRAKAISIIAMIAVAVGAFVLLGRSLWNPLYVMLTGGRTVSDAIRLYGEAARVRLAPAFADAGIVYPPLKVALLGLKAEHSVEVWAANGGEWRFVKSYPVLAASGEAGPKLREGDRRVPEGIYRIVSLNPNSSYHLSMQLDYPNDFDLQHAREDGRLKLGGGIFIHGSNVSIGCLAMGDEAIEDLFVLVADTGREDVTVLLAPQDPRNAKLPRSVSNAPKWLPQLYDRIEKEFEVFTHDRRKNMRIPGKPYVFHPMRLPN